MKADVYVASGVPVIRGTNISTTSRALEGNWVYVTEKFSRGLPNCIVEAGDLVFPHRGSIGEVAFIEAEHGRMILSSSMMKYRADVNLADTKFLFYFFRSPQGRGEILRFASQVGTPGIGQPLSSLRKFRTPVPPLPEQCAIAAVLSALDDKIELNRRMNETLEGMARALFKDWFVTFGPTRAKTAGADPYLVPEIWSLFPDRLDDDSKPEGWEERTIDDDFDVIMGQSPPGSTYNEDGSGLPFFQGRRDFDFRFPNRRVYCSEPSRIAQKDWTLLSVRAPVGDINRAWEKCCIGRGVGAFLHRSEFASFTYYVGLHLREELASYDKDGTVFGSINQKQFRGLKVLAANTDIAKAFDALIIPIDEAIRNNTAESRTLAQTRDLFLPKLMSGEIRVSKAEELVEAVA
ncbi:MAG: restriction endonuclease subunit S [Alphaproteobacteria bacterium]|nr:restriction endonuclease subunit S [Alphaproteobacteria bacterium]